GAAPMSLKMNNWIPVSNSTRIVAEMYESLSETIYVRFPNGVEWWYSNCPPEVWDAFTAPGQSRGQFIHKVLNYKPNGRYAG
ncbi:KTSC domain-containing protein, partial [Caballeronia sp. BR00000012568055]|uniref:KTSC domain-containing protein n=1 Tax=Caballeronia sp. BR00000012568055 TaxID=2918761 RepID=UPI0023F6B882